MRRSFVVIPFILLLIFNACVPNPYTISPDNTIPAPLVTAVGWTQTAMMWTPTSTPTITLTPNVSLLMGLLNQALPEASYMARVDEIERTIGAKYEIVDVMFAGENGSEVFEVYVHCECGEKTDCCRAERMLAVAMRRMEYSWNSIAGQVPHTVRYLNVICLDHGTEFATLSAEWVDVKSFMLGHITGRQFGSRVLRGAVP